MDSKFTEEERDILFLAAVILILQEGENNG